MIFSSTIMKTIKMPYFVELFENGYISVDSEIAGKIAVGLIFGWFNIFEITYLVIFIITLTIIYEIGINLILFRDGKMVKMLALLPIMTYFYRPYLQMINFSACF